MMSREVRDLIRTMSRATPLWGVPRIHGELFKLGVEISEPTVSKSMVRRHQPPSQTWRTFLENHVQSLVSVDFFTVPTIRFRVLYVFLVLAHERRRILHFGVTAHGGQFAFAAKFSIIIRSTNDVMGITSFLPVRSLRHCNQNLHSWPAGGPVCEMRTPSLSRLWFIP